MTVPRWKRRAEIAKLILRLNTWKESQRKFFRKLARIHKLNAGDLLHLLYFTFGQAMLDATGSDKRVDTFARSAYADTARLFARLGLIKIETEFSRVVIGQFVPLEKVMEEFK